MKHVFECGIVGESNDEVGDTFLAGMMDIALPPTRDRKLPDDFTIEVPEREIMRDPMLIEKYEALCRGMIDRGYEVFRWHEMDKFCTCIRFRREKK